MIHHKTSLRYSLEVVRDGKTVSRTPWRDNMLTDAGLNLIGSEYSPLCYLLTPIVGDNVSPTPVRRDGGAVTFTQAGTTLTASGNFFVAADVGRLFKFDTGTAGAECYIDGYTSGTQVSVTTTAAIGPLSGVVWYVNTAALLSPIAGLTWSAQDGAAYNYWTATPSGDLVTITHQTTRVSSAFAAPKTLTEIAFTNSGTNASVFDRDVIQPGVAAGIGDQARVTVQLISVYSGLTLAAQSNVGTGLSTAGDVWLESINLPNGQGLSIFTSSGQVNSLGGVGTTRTGGALEATCGSSSVTLFSAPIVQQPFQVETQTARSGLAGAALTLVAYGVNTYYRDRSVTFTTAQANGTFYGFGYGINGTNGLLIIRFANTVTKTNSQTLTVTFRISWSRVLTN